MSQKEIYDSLYTNNKENLMDYSDRVSPDNRSQKDKDRIKDWIENTNWESESQYHNSYHGVKCRTIRMNNKEWHRLNPGHTKNNAPWKKN